MHVGINTIPSYLKDRIKEAINIDELFQQVKAGLQKNGTTYNFGPYKLEDGILKYKNRVYIPNSEKLNKLVLK